MRDIYYRISHGRLTGNVIVLTAIVAVVWWTLDELAVLLIRAIIGYGVVWALSLICKESSLALKVRRLPATWWRRRFAKELDEAKNGGDDFAPTHGM